LGGLDPTAIIQDAIDKAREDIGAVIHLHTPNVVAVSCLEGGFQAFTQDAAYFYGKVATYDWDGVSDEASEGPAITEAVQSVEGSNTLLMHKHGHACYGRTVKEAWVLAYYFERCCEVQLNVMRSGGKICMPSKAVLLAQSIKSNCW
jgi:ribulose-5-phosphate 4-epimerase/fuculose-1-phosphate aldolase